MPKDSFPRQLPRSWSPRFIVSIPQYALLHGKGTESIRHRMFNQFVPYLFRFIRITDNVQGGILRIASEGPYPWNNNLVHISGNISLNSFVS